MYTMRPGEFTYHRPATVDEAVALLAGDGEARPLAGGHSLLPIMKLRLVEPEALVDIGRIPGLDAIETDGDGLRIGAMATHAAVAAAAAVAPRARCSRKPPRRSATARFATAARSAAALLMPTRRRLPDRPDRARRDDPRGRSRWRAGNFGGRLLPRRLLDRTRSR